MVPDGHADVANRKAKILHDFQSCTKKKAGRKQRVEISIKHLL
jgi:hypothetical protein